MGVVVKEGLKGTVVSYVGAGIGALITLFVYPYFLTPEEVGLLRLLIDVATMLSFFALLGMQSVMVKFFAQFREKGQERVFISLCFVVPLLGFVAVSGIVCLFSTAIINAFSDNSQLFVDSFYHTLPLAFALVVLMLFETLSTIYRRIFAARFIRDILVRLLTIALIFLYFYEAVHLTGLVAGLALVYGVAAVVNGVYYHHVGIFAPSSPFGKKIPRQLAWNMTKFGGNTLLAGLGGIMIGKIDVIMISSGLNLSYTGIYAIAFFIATVIEIPARSINALVVPQVSAELHVGNLQKVAELYRKVTLNQLLISGALLLLIWVNVDNIFAIMPNGGVYEAGKYVVLFIGLGKFVDLITGVNSAIINYSRYYFLIPFCTLLLGALTIVSNLILIPRLGITGAAIGSFSALFIYNTLMVVLVRVLLKVQPFTWQCLRVVVALAAAFGVALLLPTLANPYLNLALKTTVVGFFTIFVTLKFKLTAEAVEAVRMVMGRVRGVFRRKRI